MIDDETLVLFGYGDELDEREQARVAAAIDADPALATRWRQLRTELDALREVAARQAPERAVARWGRALDAAAETDGPAALAVHGRRLPWLVALAAALVVGVGLGVHLARSPTDATAPRAAAGDVGDVGSGAVAAEAAQPGADASPLAATTVRGLSDYLQQGSADLLTLTEVSGTADARTRAALVGEILARTRAYERAAVAQGAPELARVLRAFEQSLGELGREQLAPRAVRADAGQLSFEFNAMLTRLNRAASEQETTL